MEAREIENTNGRYYAGENGRIYRFKEGEYTPLKEDISTGKARVHIMGKHLSVAQLVASTFVPRIYPGCTCIKHKNGDPLDNRPDNLEWTTLSEMIKESR